MKYLLAFAVLLGSTWKANAQTISPRPLTPKERLSKLLIQAASEGDVVQIRRLVRAGANPNAYGRGTVRPLGVALQKHRFGTADVLRSCGADFSRSKEVVFDAAHDFDLPTLSYMLKRGVKPDYFSNSQGYSLLTYCIAMGDFEDFMETPTPQLKTIELLLKAGANPSLIDKMGSGALHDAAQRGSLPLTKLLLRYGADVNKPDNDGDTPLILNVAPPSGGPFSHADSGDRRAVRLLLLKAGANVNARNKRGATPVHLAAANNFATAIGDLVARGAKVNARGWNNTTPLHTSMRYGSVLAAQKLLALGADPLLKDASNHSVLDYQRAARFSHDWELNGESEESYVLPTEEMAIPRSKIAALLQKFPTSQKQK